MSSPHHVEIHGSVSGGFEAVRDAFEENFVRRRELGGACCIFHRGDKVVDLLVHDGYADLSVEIRILKRGQKEVLIRCGKQYRYVVDFATSGGAGPLAERT